MVRRLKYYMCEGEHCVLKYFKIYSLKILLDTWLFKKMCNIFIEMGFHILKQILVLQQKNRSHL